MIIDAHQHVYWHGRDIAGLISDMDSNNIEKAWLLNWDIIPAEDSSYYHNVLNPTHIKQDGTHPGIPLSDLVEAKNLYPERFILGYAPHPLVGDPAKLFEAAYKIHSVRICGEIKARIQYDDPRCLNLFRKAGELNCPVVLHMDIPYLPDEKGKMQYKPDWYGGTIENLERVLQSCSDTNFLGHAPGFWREISGDAEICPEAYPAGPIVEGGKLWQLFEKYNNLYGDLSAGSGLTALKRDPDEAIKFITAFSDKLLFARDYFGSDLLEFLKSLALSDEVRNKIYFENAQRLIHD